MVHFLFSIYIEGDMTTQLIILYEFYATANDPEKDANDLVDIMYMRKELWPGTAFLTSEFTLLFL